MDSMREEERVCMAKNTIIMLSESSSSDDSLETSSDKLFGSRRTEITTKLVM